MQTDRGGNINNIACSVETESLLSCLHVHKFYAQATVSWPKYQEQLFLIFTICACINAYDNVILSPLPMYVCWIAKTTASCLEVGRKFVL